MKAFSEACEQNKEPILAVLREVLADARTVLEIGSGTGQHAVYFGRALPYITWLTSDLPAHHPSIRAWVEEAGLPNVLAPIALDVCDEPWPAPPVDAVFSANTAHIMAWPAVECMFAGVGRVLVPGGVFCLYGPFNYGGRYTSESNARFDQWLKLRDPQSGVRDFEALERLANDAGMHLRHDHSMPANNRTLIWVRDEG